VTSTLIKGSQEKKGIRLVSKWDLKYDYRTITFVSGFLITRFENEPLLPSEVPDRHKRFIRRMGVMVFGTKPFRGLKLYPPLFDNTLVIAERERNDAIKETGESEKETRLFANEQDTELWKLQVDNTDFTTRRVTPKKAKHLLDSKMTIPQIIRSAQENSFSIRYEYIRLMNQVTKGLAATKRFLILNERGLDQKMLNHIWKTVIGVEPPLSNESVMKKIGGLLDTRI